jgi:hypothetical protein
MGKSFTLNKLDLANIKIDVKSGNPYRNAGTGKFGFELPGVQFITGRRYVEAIDTDAKNALADRVKYTNATEIGIKQDETTGELIVVLFTQGRKLDSFTLPPPSPSEGEKPPESDPAPGETGKPYEAPFSPDDEILRDAILSAARDLNLNDEQIVKAIEQRLGRELSAAEKYNFQQDVMRQRMEDLIHYLDHNLYLKINKNEPGGRVKIRTPRGYLRRTFAGFDKTQAQKVLTRLKAMGWDDKVVEDNIAGFISNKLKKELGYQTDAKE